MKRLWRLIPFAKVFGLILFGLVCTAYGEAYKKVPPKLQAKLFLKLLAFNNDINKGGAVSIYVIHSTEFASEMRGVIGNKIGKSDLTAVEQGTDLPLQKPSVIYIGDAANLNEVITYTRANNILSMTGTPDFVAKGVTLGVGAFENRPKILLNASASKEEKVNWNPVLFKISTIIKK